MQKLSIKQKFGLVLLGIFLCLFILEVGMRLWGSAFLLIQEQGNKVSALKKDEYRILCLGESTTVWGGENSWPAQLEKILNQRNTGINFKVINKGRYSIQSSYIVSIAEQAINKYNPDIVVSMMGINDGNNIVPYEQGNDCKLASFFVSLKIYKLAKILWLHAAYKLEELKNYQLKNKKIIQKNYNTDSEKNEIVYVQLANECKEKRKFKEAEELFKKALEVNPRNDEAFIELSRCYIEQGNYPEAIEATNKAWEINSENIWVYIESGYCYRELGRYLDAERVYKKALKLDPDNCRVYLDLGFYYKAQGDYSKAEEAFKKALEESVGDIIVVNGVSERSSDDVRVNGMAYIQLGICYRDQGRYDESDKILKKGIEVNPRNWEAYAELFINQRELGRDIEETMLKKVLEMGCDYSWTYQQMGWYYKDKKRYQKAEEMFKKALELDPSSSISYIELGIIYNEQKKTKEADALFKQAEDIVQGNDRIYGRLAVYYLERKDPALTDKYFKKADRVRMQYYPPITRNNYQKLKEIVSKKDIRLVCVQYPMRKLEPLKKLFTSTEGIIFVDNEKIFKAAIKQGKYEDYFEDCFAGDFGHGTPKGNKLLAENIADVIIKNVFNR